MYGLWTVNFLLGKTVFTEALHTRLIELQSFDMGWESTWPQWERLP